MDVFIYETNVLCSTRWDMFIKVSHTL